MATTNNSFHVKGKEEVQFDRKNVVVACDVVNGKITYVDVSSQLMGVLFAGDEILNVNGGVNIKTTADFIRAISAKLPGKVTIEFMRDDHCLVSEKQLPPRRPNTQMTELTLTYRGGAATGIIIHRMAFDPKTVTIAMVQSASNACHYIVMLPGNSSMQVSTIRRHPSTSRWRSNDSGSRRSEKDWEFDDASSTKTTPRKNKQFYVLLPPDVLEIMKANKDFYKKMCKNPPCVIKTSNPSQPVPATLPSDPAPEVRIPYTQSPKPLKMTPKRVGS
ncbi:hypothetical protein L3Y34_018377 [Caenorhabditis briggsae]|uniref:PDZ domain-containing protein n=1 Tax=Caenorhabditis briggsae TaxID=6238 RepID=A0AAE9DL68_CAEBR|nr:hypothetical protein L3Y34_018377 [Caenorhabditis briggsae]